MASDGDYKQELIANLRGIIYGNLHAPKGDPNYTQLECAANAYKRLKELGEIFEAEDEDVIIAYLTDNGYNFNFITGKST